jgi:hypothetical protein
MDLRFRNANRTLAPANADTERWLERQPEFVWLKPISKGRARSLSQNALMWMMYGEIARHMGLTPEEAHCMCKLEYGVPILRAESERFRCFYDAHVKRLPYQSKLRAVEFISISSVMTKDQATQYIETIVRAFAEQGLIISMPDESTTMNSSGSQESEA